MKIIELLTFFNEVELLKVHLEEHWDYVDKFVVTEAAHTYARTPKPFNLQARIEEFKPYKDKLQYEMFDMSDSLFWGGVRAHQNLQQYWSLLKHPEFMRDYDYCLHNDLDEIIDRRHWPRLLEHVKAANNPKQVRFYVRHFRNYLNWEFPGFKYEIFRLSKLEGHARFLVPDSKLDYLTLFDQPPFGYHFTFMGGPARAKYKLENFMHYGNVTPEVLKAGISKGQYSLYWRDDQYGKPVVLPDPKAEMPIYIQEHWDFFKGWVCDVPPIDPPKDAPSKRVKRGYP